MRNTYLILLGVGLLCLHSCKDNNDDTPEPVEPSIAAATNLNIADISNNGDVTDFEVSFTKPSNQEHVDSYRIYLIKSSEASTFDASMAGQVPSGNYMTLGTSEFSTGIHFDPDQTDVSGEVITENQAYTCFVMTYATAETQLAPVLSSASRNLSLEQKSAVKTITSSIQAGSGGMDVDSEGNIYMADFGNSLGGSPGTRVFKITPEGEVSIFATGLVGASGNDFDDQGNLYQSNIAGGTISKISPTGTVSTFATGLRGPVGVAFDGTSNFYVCNCSDNTISKIDSTGSVSTFSSSSLLNCPNGLDIDEEGNLYVANFSSTSLVKISPQGTATSLATMPGPNNGHLLIHGEFIYVVARGLNSIYRVTFEGIVTLYAGNGNRGLKNGALNEATFSLPNDLAFSPDGSKMYINDVATNNANTSIISPVVIREIDIIN